MRKGEEMKPRLEYTKDGLEVIRYDEEPNDTGHDVKAAFNHAEKAAKAGFTICLTDLIGAAEEQHIKAWKKRKEG